MTTRVVCVIPGDGVGREVTAAATDVLRALDLPLELRVRPAGLAAKSAVGDYLPAATLEEAKAADAVLFGAITSPLASQDPHYKSVILALRQELDLFANVRPARDFGQPCLYPGLDLLLVRENTEDVYGAPEDVTPESVVTRRKITRAASARVSEFAFQLSKRQGRRALTCVHKANVVRRGDGLFRDVFYEVAKKHPEIAAGDQLVDSVAMQLVLNPRRYDALVAPNLYGDILTDLAAGLVGGLGFAPSGSYGPRNALFEPVHGSAPDIAGKGIANPCGAILSAAMMLEYLGYPEDGKRVEAAVRAALRKGRTPDAGGALSTQEFTQLVVASL